MTTGGGVVTKNGKPALEPRPVVESTTVGEPMTCTGCGDNVESGIGVGTGDAKATGGSEAIVTGGSDETATDPLPPPLPGLSTFETLDPEPSVSEAVAAPLEHPVIAICTVVAMLVEPSNNPFEEVDVTAGPPEIGSIGKGKKLEPLFDSIQVAAAPAGSPAMDKPKSLEP